MVEFSKFGQHFVVRADALYLFSEAPLKPKIARILLGMTADVLPMALGFKYEQRSTHASFPAIWPKKRVVKSVLDMRHSYAIVTYERRVQ